MNCEICEFNNPKSTATAIVIKDQKVLVLKRNEEPFKGMWDLPGGYANLGETPEDCIKRELVEELGVKIKSCTPMKEISGEAEFNGKKFAVLNSFFLVDIRGDINLNDENSEYKFLPLEELNNTSEWTNIAFATNQEIVPFLHENFKFNLDDVKELMHQLDDSAVLDEQALYKASLDGFVSKKYDEKKLIGMGWIFPRQTMLRKQAVVEDMIVNKNYRGKGLGEEILYDLLGWAEEQGVEVVELTTNHMRLAANGLYMKAGFRLHETNHYLLNL